MSRFATLVAALALAVVAFAEPVPAPERTPSPDRTGKDSLREIVTLLRLNRLKYGDDAAVMQALLLTRASHADAVVATEVTITGYEQTESRDYVAFLVESGAIYDDRLLDRPERLERVWRSILEPAFREYPRFEVPADGIAVEIRYSHRQWNSLSELYRTITDRGVVERAKFYFLSADLARFVRGERSAQQLLDGSTVLLDDRPVRLELHDPVGPADP